MTDRIVLAPLALALVLSACGKPAARDEGGPPPVATLIGQGAATNDTAAAPDAAVPAAAPPAGSSVPAPDEASATLPAAAAAPDSAQAAVDVVKTYYALLDQGRYRDAWALWGDGGKRSGKTPEQFAAGFASTADTQVDVGAPGDSEGAAGSVFIEVPVTVTARLKDGTPQRFAGSYTLRRVNDVPGSTASQRRWHIESATLKPVPAS